MVRECSALSRTCLVSACLILGGGPGNGSSGSLIMQGRELLLGSHLNGLSWSY